MKVNRNLSVAGCWKMIGAIENGKDLDEIWTRCEIATEWLIQNEVISLEEFDSMMSAITYISMEACKEDRRRKWG